ncbi:MAG TPA: sugar phosphate isomerase/epimerase family protein [Verrucomicrobiota bacterium]|nr:D-tagatose 3-epimerase [Verrucomicrobiales bacterium]HRI13933.1 sugar phosphate isomerase/epimerase family protein [Verrucomicrobiota bacterium]
MRFAICNEIFQDWPFERACAFAKRAGYDAIELAPFTFAPLITGISPTQRSEIRRAAQDAGLAVSGIHWVLARTVGFHVNHPDPAVRAKTSDYLSAAVEFCAAVGGQFMIFGSPKSRDVLPGVALPDAIRWTQETFTQAIRTAEQAGVTICLEPLAPTETNFLTTAAEALAVTDGVGSPAFKIMLDVKAMCSEPTPIPELIHGLRGRFAYFHANDRNLKGPGFGEVDFGPIAAALRSAGYDGTVSVEVFKFDEGPEVIATQSREYLRSKFGR